MATQKNINFTVLPVMIILMIFASCHRKAAGVQEVPAQAVLVTVVDYHELDGCEYLLELPDGQKLQPVNLPDEMKRAGLKLFITFKYHDGVGICMAGKMISLTSVSIAKEDNR